MVRRYGAKRVNHELQPTDRTAADIRELVDLIEARINEERAESYARGLAARRTPAPRSWSMIDSTEDLPDRVTVDGYGAWHRNRGTDVYVCDHEARGLYSLADLRELGRVTEVLP
jgi:hypothetical protein